MKLLYLYGFRGSDSVEPSTGSIVDLHDDETVYATPDPTVLPKLSAILAKYKTVPAAVQGVTALGKLAANPIKVFENKFSADAGVDRRHREHGEGQEGPEAPRSRRPSRTRCAIGGIALFVVGLLLAIVPKRRKPNTADFSGPITIATDPDLFVGPGRSSGGGPSDPPVP